MRRDAHLSLRFAPPPRLATRNHHRLPRRRRHRSTRLRFASPSIATRTDDIHHHRNDTPPAPPYRLSLLFCRHRAWKVSSTARPSTTLFFSHSPPRRPQSPTGRLLFIIPSIPAQTTCDIVRKRRQNDTPRATELQYHAQNRPMLLSSNDIYTIKVTVIAAIARRHDVMKLSARITQRTICAFAAIRPPFVAIVAATPHKDDIVRRH